MLEIACGVCKKVLCTSDNEKESIESLAKACGLKKVSISIKDFEKDIEYNEEFFICNECFIKLKKDLKLLNV
jgi:hypothetical protein